MDKILIDDKYSVSFLTDISITNAHTNHIVGILLIFRIFSDQFSVITGRLSIMSKSRYTWIFRVFKLYPSFFTVYLTCGGNGAFAWTDLNLDYGLFKSAKTFDVFSYLCVYQLLNYCALFCTNICMPWLEATRPWLVCHPIAAASMYSKLFQNITFVCNCNNHCKTKFYFT